MSKTFTATLAFGAALGVTAAVAACGSSSTAPAPSASASTAMNEVPTGDPIPVHPHVPPAERTGSAIARSVDGDRLYLADEDHKMLRILPLPFTTADGAAAPGPDASAAPSSSASPAPSAASSARPHAPGYGSAAPHAPGGYGSAAPPPAAPPGPGARPLPVPPSAKEISVPLPGAPAQIVALDGQVLVTIRDPGLLMIFDERTGATVVEAARVELPADAWGVAVSADEKIAVVTSAWTHEVSGIDLAARKVTFSLATAREPRGVVIPADGDRAYVSHLTSGDLTRVDGISGAAATLKTIHFPAAPDRSPQGGGDLEATLGYALALDDGGHRLLAGRLALGAIASQSWYGASTVDVLQLDDDTPLLAPREPSLAAASPLYALRRSDAIEAASAADKPKDDKPLPIVSSIDWEIRPFLSPQPTARAPQLRAMAVAHKSKTIWVAGEGDDTVTELDERSASPLTSPLRTLAVADTRADQKIYGTVPSACGAPQGLALSADEGTLYVFCRSTYDVEAIDLGKALDRPYYDRVSATGTVLRVADDPVDTPISRGRRIFYGARDAVATDAQTGLACAACHPDGRDDGHVWHEVHEDSGDPKDPSIGWFLATKFLADHTRAGRLGYPRQTPMLAGRLTAGPYGWHAENPTLAKRIADGFARHRWQGGHADPTGWVVGEHAIALEAFLAMLPMPPKADRPLSDLEQKGKAIFESPEAQCSTCHVPSSGFTNRVAYDTRAWPLATFEDETDLKFKTPSLLGVGGSAPYFHDGRFATLEALLDQDQDTMGKTTQLSADDKKALVAYLETL